LELARRCGLRHDLLAVHQHDRDMKRRRCVELEELLGLKVDAFAAGKGVGSEAECAAACCSDAGACATASQGTH
jgi:hypothetical protein